VTDNPFIYENQHLNSLVARLYSHLRAYGYEHVQVPAIADVDLFLKKSGDQVIERLFTFERFGRMLALRPEFTALAAHRYASAHPHGDAVVRWQFNGSVFQENHETRQYQQMSFGAELIGTNSPLADAEMVLMAATGLKDVVGMGDVQLSVGHVGLLRHALARFQLDERTEQFLLTQLHQHPDLAAAADDVMAAFDEHFTVRHGEGTDAGTDVLDGTQQMLDVMLDATQMGQTMGGRSRSDIVRRMIRKGNRALQRSQVQEALNFLIEWGGASSLAALKQLGGDDDTFVALMDEFETFIDLLAAGGLDVDALNIAPALARDWNYYTGLVFSFNSPEGVALGGGGRYDELVQILGADANVPAIGFAYYLDDILTLLDTNPKAQLSDVINLHIGHASHAEAVRWATELRAAGWDVLLREDAPDDGETTVELDDDGNATLSGQTYSLDQLTSLTKQLKDA